MKKCVFSFIFCLFAWSGYSQFAAQGTQWHYTQCTNNFPYTCGPVEVNVMGQQMVNGINCSQLQIAPFSCVGFNYLPVYQSNDTVYRFLYNVNTFTMLYDFNANAGDVWDIISNTQNGGAGSQLLDTVQILIDSTSFISVNGFQRKILYTSYLNPNHKPFIFEGPIVEGIGSLNFLLPQFNGCDPLSTTFRCYQDSVVGLYQPNTLVVCDSVIPVGENEIARQVKFSVYPNPFDSNICIHADNYLTQGYDITVVDAIGKIHKEFKGRTDLNEKTLDLSFLKQGVYFLVFKSKNELVQKRIVKL